jgi:hypothetical protein
MKCALRIFFIVSLVCTATRSFSQSGRALIDSLARRMDTYSRKPAETSVYLTSNKDIYVAGEDLWYNAFVLESRTLGLAEQDNILYLRLLKEDSDTAVWNEMYPISHGLSAGHVYLPQTLQEGRYLLKAYTAHSFFSLQPYFYAVAPIQIVKDPRSVKNNWQPGQTTSPRQGEKIHMEVFPEGGILVAGVQNTVAFRAVNKDRQPVTLKAQLLKDGSSVLDLETRYPGMGLFRFIPEANAVYTIRYEGDALKMPSVVTDAIALHLQGNGNDSLIFKITTPHPKMQPVLLRVQTRGAMQVIAAGMLKDSLLIKIPIAHMPPGVAEATLFDDKLHSLASRLVYLHPDKKLHIRFSQLKETYGPKEPVTLKISTTDAEGRPVATALSLRVYDRLFNNRKNTRDILNYYYLSTQLRDTLYDPSYYFDTAHIDRKEALDVLLLAHKTQQYNLSEERMARELAVKKPVLSDSVSAAVTALNKPGKKKAPLSVMLFNYSKSINQVATTDNDGTFYLTPENLSIGQRFFIKYFSEKEHKIFVADPFDSIRSIEARQHPVNLLNEKTIVIAEKGIDSNMLQYGNMLKEIVVQSKGREFGDPYLGYLDSIAKFEGNTDYVGQCGWLNCPACGSGTKPIEGVAYSELTAAKRSQVSSHPFSFGPNDMKKEPYHYPQYTAEELMKKFKMVITKGFYQHAAFYSPDYEKEDKMIVDTRNALYWNPLIITDQNGEATIRFFCSDIRSGFIGEAAGVSGDGYIGTGTFNFSVR